MEFLIFTAGIVAGTLIGICIALRGQLPGKKDELDAFNEGFETPEAEKEFEALMNYRGWPRKGVKDDVEGEDF